MIYGHFKNLTRRAAADEVLRNIFNIAKNPNYNEYQRAPASIVSKCFDRETTGGAVKNEIIQYKELAKELQKPIIRKFEKRKVHSSFINNIFGC